MEMKRTPTKSSSVVSIIWSGLGMIIGLPSLINIIGINYEVYGFDLSSWVIDVYSILFIAVGLILISVGVLFFELRNISDSLQDIRNIDIDQEYKEGIKNNQK